MALTDLQVGSSGSRVAPTGPPLLLVRAQGPGELSAWFDRAALSLSEHFTVRDHDISAATREHFDLEELADGLYEMSQRHTEPFAIAGYGRGALVGLRFTVDHPELVTRLVLVEAPSPPWRLVVRDVHRRHRPARMIRTRRYEGHYVFRNGTPPARLRTAAGTTLVATDEASVDLQEEPSIADAQLAQLTVPVLSVYAQTSGWLSAGDRFARVIPSARLLIAPSADEIDGAGDLLEAGVRAYLSEDAIRAEAPPSDRHCEEIAHG